MERRGGMTRIMSSIIVDTDVKLDNKTLASMKGTTPLITGDIDSFGDAVLNRFLATDIGETHILGQDEEEQGGTRREYQSKCPRYMDKIKFYIGGIRDTSSIQSVMIGVNCTFHTAALKQVPSCEFFPIEAVETNVFGTKNVLTATIGAGVKAVVCLSTNKTAYPVNTMGASKAMMEEVMATKPKVSKGTKICCTQRDNITCSRGSVVPLWIKQICAG